MGNDSRKRRILISVTDKNKIEKFAKLVDVGWEIVSTGGTATVLTTMGIPHVLIEEVTGFPEMMGGRLKTLDPNIFGGILADRDKPEHLEAIAKHGIELFDIVVVNLYKFGQDQSIEKIDIGGPSLLRAAAKNHKFVTVVVDPDFYDLVISEVLAHGNTTPETRQALAAMVFEHTFQYDQAIAKWFRQDFRGVHPSHQTKSSDASSYDEICTVCRRTDEVPGGPGDLRWPCPGPSAQ